MCSQVHAELNGEKFVQFEDGYAESEAIKTFPGTREIWDACAGCAQPPNFFELIPFLDIRFVLELNLVMPKQQACYYCFYNFNQAVLVS